MPASNLTSDILIPDLSRAFLISNAGSGINLKHGLERVENASSAAGLRHQCVNDIETLTRTLRDSARRGERLIIINAGDGTVSRVLEAIRNGNFFPREPALALLRGGTTNMIHNDVGIPGRPEDALQKLLDCLDQGRYAYRKRHVLRVTDSSHHPPRYGFFLGTHAALKGILRAREQLHLHVSTGRWSELLSVGAMIWRLLRRRAHQDPVLSPIPLEISRDGGPWRQCAHILLLAMSVQTAILGVHPLRRGQRAGLAMLNWPDYRLMPWLWRFVSGGVEAFDTISLRGGFGWILDGETHEHRSADGVLTIEVDAPVSFLVPDRER